MQFRGQSWLPYPKETTGSVHPAVTILAPMEQWVRGRLGSGCLRTFGIAPCDSEWAEVRAGGHYKDHLVQCSAQCKTNVQRPLNPIDSITFWNAQWITAHIETKNKDASLISCIA